MTTLAPTSRLGSESEAGEGVLELDRLTVRFGRKTILHELTGRVTGRAVGLLGPNGAGKTTLIHTLLGFHRPAGGSARLLGRDVLREGRRLRRDLGYMPERDAFIAGMSAVRFVRMMAELSGLPPRRALERAHEALFWVGLGEARYRPLESYSLGMRQQAKLAQAIAHGPRVLFLDEPTNGLDPPHRRRMLDLIRAIRDAGTMRVIISSHLLRDVEECCDQVLVLHQGRIAAIADLEAERRTNRRLVELQLSGDGDGFAAALVALGCRAQRDRGGRVRAVLSDGVAVRDLFRIAGEQGVQIRRLAFKRDSLDEIFQRAVSGRVAPAVEETADGRA